MLYKSIIRPILFLFNPESVHNFTMFIISKFTFIYPFIKFLYAPQKDIPVIVNGLKFRNPLGLAAGFDKDGEAIRFWDAIGFSHIEVGTVTPMPQSGNPKPRLYRLIKDKAVINRMGFNNKGADELREKIIKAKKKIKDNFIIGVNIGKNKITPLESAAEDYKICIEKLYDAADYFTINISSPNTEGLRELQGEKYLDDLLLQISDKNTKLAAERNVIHKTIFLKIAPDLSEKEIEQIYERVVKYGIDGIIAANTTLSRNGLKENNQETGGLSGKPLKEISDAVLKRLNELNLKNQNNKVNLIGCGGVFDYADYKEKLSNGAELVQIYTGFIYEGLNIIKKILCLEM
ncbi:MAG TPA: quinone-dependent dihydroorotate dehydrogenase [Ignavibacteria bacterium]